MSRCVNTRCGKELEVGQEGLCERCLGHIHADTRLEDYCRAEGPWGEKAECIAAWIRELQEVSALIVNSWISSNGAEVRFSMTLRQAYDIGWAWQDMGSDYLAELVGEQLGWEGDYLAPLTARIQALFEAWSDAEESRGKE
jgi:hypothetical protein